VQRRRLLEQEVGVAHTQFSAHVHLFKPAVGAPITAEPIAAASAATIIVAPRSLAVTAADGPQPTDSAPRGDDTSGSSDSDTASSSSASETVSGTTQNLGAATSAPAAETEDPIFDLSGVSPARELPEEPVSPPPQPRPIHDQRLAPQPAGSSLAMH
jgi:hypothetical protein